MTHRPPGSQPAGGSLPGGHLVVDGMNVIGTKPDGWWRDRDGAARRLVGRLQRLTQDTGQPVTLVLEGRPVRDLPEGVHDGVTVVYARRRGRDAGDDRLVELLASFPDPGGVQVVTSDRALAARVEAQGARVAGARWLVTVLDQHEHPDSSQKPR